MSETCRTELFVDLSEIEPSIKIDLKYFTGDNFIGERIHGYDRNICLLTKPTAVALQRVQHELAEFGLGLKVFDAYRPQRAVDHFINWCELSGPCFTKEQYFPTIERDDLFRQGYLVKQSSHSRGSTVDLTIIDLNSDQELGMGTAFDFFGPESWFDCSTVNPEARANRMLLQRVMTQNGFVPFQQEWWHFTLQGESYPDKYFDFPVE